MPAPSADIMSKAALRLTVALLLVCALVLALRVYLWNESLERAARAADGGPITARLIVREVEVRSDGVALLGVRLLEVPARDAHAVALQGRAVRLSWYQAPSVSIGDELVATLQLRRPWSYASPGAFDYAAWLRSQGFVASGYVRGVLEHRRAAERAPTRVGRLGRVGLVNPGLLAALTVGDRSGVSDTQWQLFRETGTLHLMVISGLHVGVACGLTFVFSSFLLRMMRLGKGGAIARRAALAMSSAVALVYLCAVGFQPAVARAVAMSVLVTVGLMFARSPPGWRVLATSAALATLLRPEALFAQGFALSYIAVACLLFYFVPRRPRPSFVRALLACQGVLAMGLTPWQGMIVGDAPLLAPLANLLVVPLMTLVAIPTAMVGILLLISPFEMLGAVVLRLPDFLLTLLQTLLVDVSEQIAFLAGSRLGYFRTGMVLLAAGAFLALAVPLAFRWRVLSLLGVLPLALANPVNVTPGEFRVWILDVGQGSAAIVDTARHRLVVDTGARFASGFNLGDAVVLPALRASGPPHLHALLLSHLDTDHAGGLEAVRRFAPDARALGVDSPCGDEVRWQWDGVRLQVLADGQGTTVNDRSCTLRIDGANTSAYLAGDIGALSEARLLDRLGSVELLVVPHHGSISSSSAKFLRTLSPRYAVISAGRDNRYGHPHPTVVKRLRAVGARVFLTARDGAVVWHSRGSRIATMRE